MLIDASPEMQFIIAAISAQKEQQAARLKQLIDNGVNWNEIFLMSLWHKVAFIVLESLKSNHLLSYSVTNGKLHLLLLNHWKQLAKVNLHRNNLYLSELNRIGQILNNAGIKWAVGKGGPLLFGRVYSLSERKIYDLDLIANKSDLDNILLSMRTAGYDFYDFDHDNDTFVAPPPLQLRKWLMVGRGMPNLLRRVDDLFLDYFIVQISFKIGTTKVQRESIPASVFLGNCYTSGLVPFISDVDLFIQLALHIYREANDDTFSGWNMDWSLIKFCDLQRFYIYLFKNPEVKRECFKRIFELQFEKQLLFSLYYLNQIFPADNLVEMIDYIVNSKSSLNDYYKSLSKIDLFPALQLIGRNSSTNCSDWENLIGPKTN